MNARQNPRWEYKTLRFKKSGWFTSTINIDEFEQELNRMGRQGWELVNVTTVALKGTWDGSGSLVAMLKRPL